MIKDFLDFLDQKQKTYIEEHQICKESFIDYSVLKSTDLQLTEQFYKKWVVVELSAENKRQLLIPRGFLHGFVTLTDDVEFLYKADRLYDAGADRKVLWSDPDIGVDWGIDDPIVSDKDKNAPLLKDSDIDFVYEER